MTVQDQSKKRKLSQVPHKGGQHRHLLRNRQLLTQLEMGMTIVIHVSELNYYKQTSR